MYNHYEEIMTISSKNLAFVDEYFKCNMVGVEAYQNLYPSSSYESARRAASRLLTNVDIREEINRRLTEKHMGADEVLARLAEQAKGLGGKYVKDNGELDFRKIKEDGKTHLLQSIEPTKFGTKVQFPPIQTALINIGKQHGLFSDKHIIETRVEKELDSILEILEETLSPDDFQRIVARLTSGPTGGSEVETEEPE